MLTAIISIVFAFALFFTFTFVNSLIIQYLAFVKEVKSPLKGVPDQAGIITAILWGIYHLLSQ